MTGTSMIHDPYALSYRLIDGLAPLEPLRVLDSRSVEWAGGLATFYILGASHALHLDLPRCKVTELLTCAPPPGRVKLLACAELCTHYDDHFVRLDRSVDRRIPSHWHVDAHAPIATQTRVNDYAVAIAKRRDFSSHCTIRSFALDDEARLANAYDLTADLAAEYPGPASDPPLTRLGWFVEARALRLHTLHTYPEFGVGVVSLTRLELRGPRA